MRDMEREWWRDAENVEGFLLDIYGVLYNDGHNGPEAIEGSVEAIERLKASGVPLLFCSNTTTQNTEQLATLLCSLGFKIKPEEIFLPTPVVKRVLKEKDLRPFLFVHKNLIQEFAAIDQTNPNCVVLGDAQENFSYENMNQAFKVLREAENPVLLTMGAGKYYRYDGGLVLYVGPYAKALEYACNVPMEIIGKPAKAFYLAALEQLGLSPDKCIMIGDDILSDVRGAQKCGMRALQVRTGKYRPSDEPHTDVTPQGYVNNLLEAVHLFLQDR